MNDHKPICPKCSSEMVLQRLNRSGSITLDGPWYAGFFERNGGNLPKPEIRWRMVCPVCSKSGRTVA